jgi:hypothetical protein
MRDEDQLFLRPAKPPRYDEASATGSDLEFIVKLIAALPTRRELTRFAVWVVLGLCVLAIVGCEMWWRHVSACGG